VFFVFENGINSDNKSTPTSINRSDLFSFLNFVDINKREALDNAERGKMYEKLVALI
jgi:hypothetical protein